MLRRSFFYRVLACVAALFGLRLSGEESLEVWGAQVETLPQPQPMTVYARFVARDPNPRYVEWSQPVVTTHDKALERSDYGRTYDMLAASNPDRQLDFTPSRGELVGISE